MWRWVNVWSRRALLNAGERVADVQGDDDDFEEEIEEKSAGQSGGSQPATESSSNPEMETRKTQ